MKYLNKKFILAVGCLALTACSDMDDMTPDSGSMTEAQLEMTTTAIPKRANADLTGIYTYAGEMAAALNSASIHCDYGYPSLCTAVTTGLLRRSIIPTAARTTSSRPCATSLSIRRLNFVTT